MKHRSLEAAPYPRIISHNSAGFHGNGCCKMLFIMTALVCGCSLCQGSCICAMVCKMRSVCLGIESSKWRSVGTRFANTEDDASGSALDDNACWITFWNIRKSGSPGNIGLFIKPMVPNIFTAAKFSLPHCSNFFTTTSQNEEFRLVHGIPRKAKLYAQVKKRYGKREKNYSIKETMHTHP